MKRIFALVTGSALAGCAAWLLACGPFTVDLQPVLERSPADTRAYATGELGVVRPQFALRYLLQAYRTLTPGASNRDATAATIRADPNSGEPDPVNRWAQTIRALLGTTNADGHSATVEQSRHVPGEQYQTFLNCPDEAFASALRTLKTRSEQFGNDSAAVRDWARAQAAVFENCHDGPLVLPVPAADAADEFARADRAYQTAAAHFYAMDYEQAAKEFRAIAADGRSVWRPFGRYLAARATIRFATVPTSSPDRERLAAAETDLRAALDDAAAAPLHPSARGLLGYLSARIHPIERLHELSRRLTVRQPPDDQDFNDYRFILDAVSGPTAPFARSEIARNDDLTDWLLAMRDGGDTAGTRALEQWRATNTPHWLVAALWHLRAPGPDADTLLDAARALPRQSPAFPTVAFLRVRLLTAVGRERDARSFLSSLPRRPAPGFNAETVNLFNAERLMLAENLDQFLTNAPRTVVVEWADPPRIPGGPRVLKTPNHDQPVLDEDAATTLSEHLPLTRLVDAALSPRLPPRLRLRVAMAAFTRVIVLKRDDAGARLVPVLRELGPALGADLDRYARATSTADRYNAGVLLLLNTPGATVDVRGPEDDYAFGVTEPARAFDHLFRRNWWCDSNGRFHSTPGGSAAVHLLYPDDAVGAPAFVTAAERDTAARERRAILAEGPPRLFLGRAAIRLAAQHPDEPAVAEALARVVDSWRWTCGADEGSATPLPQQAFALLHRLYPKSDAAQRTKYWYRN